MKKTISAMLLLIATTTFATGCVDETISDTDTEVEVETNQPEETETNGWKLSFEGYEQPEWYFFAPYSETEGETLREATLSDTEVSFQNTEKRILLGGGYDVFPSDMYEGQDYIRMDISVSTLPAIEQLEEVQFGENTYYSWDRCAYDSCDAPGVTSTVYYYEKNGEVFSFEIHTGSEVSESEWQEVLATEDTAQTTTLVETNREGTMVYYSGSITVSGTYKEYRPDTLIGETLCFYPDEETAYLIPRSEEDSRIAWFCFSNQETAKELFEINEAEAFADETVEYIEGTATVTVSDYTVNLLEAAVYDTAQLDTLISKD